MSEQHEGNEQIIAAPADISPYHAAQIATRAAAKRNLLNGKGEALVYQGPAMYSRAKNDSIKSHCDAGSSGHKAHANCKNVQLDGASFKTWLTAEMAARVRGEGGRRSVNIEALVASYDA